MESSHQKHGRALIAIWFTGGSEHQGRVVAGVGAKS